MLAVTLLGLVSALIPATAAQMASHVEKALAGTTFDTLGGLQDQPIQVAISTPTAGAVIRYTTNAEPPTASHGTPYTGPLTLSHTTLLRAAAFKEGQPPSPVDTRTYVFVADVRRQGATPAGFPTHWGVNNGQPVPADYEMDPEIVEHPKYRDEFLPALRSLPSMFLTVAPGDLFDPKRGLYSNPRESGPDWERPVAVEFQESNQARGFRIEGGLRVQGGWNRRPEESPKHAFRLAFRKKYGAGKLHHPVFGVEGVREFDELILRAGCNNTWLHWSGEERHRGDFLRDPWMRATYAAMGHLSARGRFVHLYLNGLYWGLYNLVERPAGPFVAAHLGGSPGKYDVRNGANLLEGNNVAWKELVRRLEPGALQSANPTPLTALQPLLDLAAFADYMLLNLYGANGDWDAASNWYAARRRSPPGPFQFFVWDGERNLEKATDDVVDYDAEDSPPRLFQRLRQLPAFRDLFAERARLHLMGAGALTPGPAAARFEALAREIDSAVIAESARWGDYRRDAHRYKTGPYELYTRNDHWRPEIRRLREEYFPRRTAVLIQQLKDRQLFR
jgi:hypothetical protein